MSMGEGVSDSVKNFNKIVNFVICKTVKYVATDEFDPSGFLCRHPSIRDRVHHSGMPLYLHLI